MPCLRAVLFDYNGTLLNDLPLAFASVQKIFRCYQLPEPTLEQYRDEITSNFMEFYWNHGMPRQVTGDDLNKIRKEYFKDHWTKAYFRPDTESVLKKCREQNLLVAIVSAEIKESLEKRLAEAKLDGYFHLVRTQAWPKKEALAETVERLNIPAPSAVYVDDTHEGITDAKSLGMKTIGLTAGYNSVERIIAANPDFVINELSELIPHIVHVCSCGR